MPTARWNGAVIAASDDTVIIEGNHYFLSDSLDESLLEESDTRTYCPWKGEARYKSIIVDGQRNADAAWYYPDPKSAAAAIKGRFAFWKGVKVE